MIKATKNFLTVNGERAPVSYSTGPWIDGVDPSTIKIYLRGKNRYLGFPKSFREAFAIENNSDMMTDYFEADAIRITSAHPLYKVISEAAA